MTDNEDLVHVLNLGFGRARIAYPGPAEPRLLAFCDENPPHAIAAKFLVTSIRMRLLSDGGRVV